MDAARQIRTAVETVSALRSQADAGGALRTAIAEVKQLQSRRFRGTYADLLADPAYAPASRFFLEELYSDKDYAERDAQFARIAGAIEKLFPQQVTQTAVSLAQLHALTEDLDHAMGVAWLQSSATAPAGRYVQAWRAVGRRADRERQLAVVMDVGDEMVRLTRAPGLRMMLRMMRGPAAAAGMGSLQRFLETGFDTFAGMARHKGRAEAFLRAIREREEALIVQLFAEDPVASGTALAETLGQAR